MKFNAKLEMAILVALTYLFAKTRKARETRKAWMERAGYIWAAELYMR